MLLALDDTDGPAGGCTSHAALQVAAALEAAGMPMRRPPRLVRLNPNVPHKTRGNAAAVLDVDGDAERAVNLAWRIVAQLAQPTAHPAVVAVERLPHEAWYWRAVRTRLDCEAARTYLREEGALFRTDATGRALSGCLGALAWPGAASSHELTFYRDPSTWGTPRRIEVQRLRGLDEAGLTFHTWDPEEDRLCAAPHTPCPVLFGVRGRDRAALERAAPAIANAAAEPVEGRAMWATNQGSGDHVTPVACAADAPAWSTISVAATVARAPRVLRGGHVVVSMIDEAGQAFDALAFEPTRGLRRVAAALRPGDDVEAVGAWDGSLRLEKLHVASARRVADRPRCVCGRTMRSRGRAAGYQCGCGRRAAPGAERWSESGLEGWHEVPVLARRHLHRPLAWGEPGGRGAVVLGGGDLEVVEVGGRVGA